MSINFTTKNSIDWTDSSGTTKNIDTEFARVDNEFANVGDELSLKANQATTLAGYEITDGLEIGKVARTSTVVVGLQSSGYTTDQVDILITPTDNVADKIIAAFNKLPSVGGEIKFLEGTYDTAATVITIQDKTVCLSGVGSSTYFKSTVSTFRLLGNSIVTFQNLKIRSLWECIKIEGYSDVAVSNCILISDEQTRGTNINIYTDNLKLRVSNTLTNILGKTASNWRNIYIDGVAECLLFSGDTILTNEFQTFGNINIQIDDEIIVWGAVTNVTAFTRATVIKRIDINYGEILFNGAATSLVIMAVSNGIVKLLHTNNPFAVAIGDITIRRYI